MYLNLLAALSITASPGCPHTPLDQPPPVSADPDWLTMPDPNALYWAYPTRAMAEKVEGTAVIECDVSIQGVADNCQIVSENPKGYGFGDATVSVISKMLFKPKVQCGVVVPGKIRIPLSYKLPPDATVTSTAALDPSDKKLALAAELVDAIGSADSLKAWVEYSIDELVYSEGKTRDVPADERKAIREAIDESWAPARVKVANAIARTFASEFSEEELQEALRFYRGPVGKKLISLGPQFEEKMRGVYDKLQPDLILQFHQHYCEKLPAKCTPPDAL